MIIGVLWKVALLEVAVLVVAALILSAITDFCWWCGRGRRKVSIERAYFLFDGWMQFGFYFIYRT